MSSLFLFALGLVSVNALHFPVTRSYHAPRASASEIGTDSIDLKTVRDLIYMANITIGGTNYPMQIDTGSSDLWIQPTDFPLPNVRETDTLLNLTYGLGWAYGALSYADVEFSGMPVSQQAFVHAKTVNNPALSYGADGILGLGFTALSNIDVAETQDPSGGGSGKSLLYRMFEQDKEQPNFIAFSLQRTHEIWNEVEGSFSIGELDPDFVQIKDMPSIPTFPEETPKRWNILVDALMVGERIIVPATSVPDAPSNAAVALLDTGTSYSYVPRDVAEAIYSSAPGAQLDTRTGYWTVPCNVEIDVAIQIGGQVLPLHPLDITPKSLPNPDICIGSFVPAPVSVSAGQFDWLIGDNVLRSMYNVYDFGDYDSDGNMGHPYVKLLSIVEPDAGSAQFATARGSTPRTGIKYGAVDGTRADAKTTSITLSTDVAKTLSMLGTVFPALLAIMALNAVVVFGLFVFGVWYFCRRSRRRNARNPTRATRGRMTPLPMDARHSYVAGGNTPHGATPEPHNNHAMPHSYQPVSMAMTEDTFVPTTPTYSKFGMDSKIMPGDRPRSMAVPLHVARESISESVDEPFLPPTPAFHADAGSTLRPGASGRNMADRPNSVA